MLVERKVTDRGWKWQLRGSLEELLIVFEKIREGLGHAAILSIDDRLDLIWLPTEGVNGLSLVIRYEDYVNEALQRVFPASNDVVAVQPMTAPVVPDISIMDGEINHQSCTLKTSITIDVQKETLRVRHENHEWELEVDSSGRRIYPRRRHPAYADWLEEWIEIGQLGRIAALKQERALAAVKKL